MNDMIENTNTKQKLIEFQQSRKLGTYGFEKGKVTNGWWRGFLRRNENKLVTKRGEKFALNRHDWTTLPNIKQMYEVIYDEMEDAGVAIELQTPIFTDIDGNPVDEAKQFGMKQKIKITTPEWILFADESGFSTAQKKAVHGKRDSPSDNCIYNRPQIYLASIHFCIRRGSLLCGNFSGQTK